MPERVPSRGMGVAATFRYWVFGRSDRALETTDFGLATPTPRLGAGLGLVELFGLDLP
jgi:hypothetical protein